MAAIIGINDLIMIDLTSVPLEDLKAELTRRKAVAREAREKERDSKVCCNNCAYRIQGKTNDGPLQGYDSWVCYKKPKKNGKTYFEGAPTYARAFFACSSKHKGCTMFVHKKTAEGEKIARKLSSMSDRMS